MRKSKYTKELLEPIIKESKSWAQVLRRLNLKQTGGNQVHIQSRVRYLKISVNHFTGELWSKGLTAETHSSIARTIRLISLSNDDVFIQNSRPISGSKIKKRLLKLGWKYVCKICGINSWLSKPLVLHLDHINGIHNDNRFENLRFLCPNCHQQTDTWGNKTGV